MTEKNEVYIDGRLIQTELDFHRTISSALDFGPYYGNNLDALWDLLSAGGDGRSNSTLGKFRCLEEEIGTSV